MDWFKKDRVNIKPLLDALQRRIEALETREAFPEISVFEKRLEAIEQRHAQLHSLLVQTSPTTGRDGLTKPAKGMAETYKGMLFGGRL